MKHVGKPKDLHKEKQRINKAIEETFEVVDSENVGFGDKRLILDTKALSAAAEEHQGVARILAGAYC